MNIFDSAILGAVQGLTEFLPISSSGHLVIAESLLGLEVESLLSFDIAVHVGTLIAILAYFWRDILKFLKTPALLWVLFVGSLPIVVAGLGFGDISDAGDFRTIGSVGGFMIVAALVFLLAERFAKSKKQVKVEGLNAKRAFVIGLFQAVALIPGVSRSGMTISGGLFQGLRRDEAARFSFLLGAVAIAGAATLTIAKSILSDESNISLDLWPTLVGFLVSGIVGYFAIWGLMKFLKKNSLLVFAIYLLVVGGTALGFYSL
jgi:undecaprenyl-diphosphatase